MIKEIKIENFKSIASLNLELGRLNVFIGANGSGKSNILEAIAFASSAVYNRFANEFLYAKGVRKTDNQLIKSGFKALKNANEINISIKFSEEDAFMFNVGFDYDKKKLSTPLKISGHFFNSSNRILDEMLKRQSDKLIQSDFDYDADEKKKNALELLINDFLIFAPENYFLRRFEEDTQIEPLGIRGEGLFSHLVNIVREKPLLFSKIKENLKLIDWFEDLEIPNNLMFTERRLDFKDSNLVEGVRYIDQRSVNEGILYLLFYLTLFISEETPQFFAIDNIDNAMNPKLGKKLIKVLGKLATEHDKQAILTTHNPAILDGLNLDNPKLDQRLFVVYRDLDGCTSIRRIFKKQLENGVESLPLSEQFLRGYLGGLPDNF